MRIGICLFCSCCISSVAQLCLTLCDPMNCSTPGLPVHHQLPEFTQTHVHRVDDAIQPSHPLSPHFLLPSVFPSIRVFSSELALHIRWPKYWSFSCSISLSNEYSGLISFRIDWFDLLAVQGTLKSLIQHHSSKASILWHSVKIEYLALNICWIKLFQEKPTVRSWRVSLWFPVWGLLEQK